MPEPMSRTETWKGNILEIDANLDHVSAWRKGANARVPGPDGTGYIGAHMDSEQVQLGISQNGLYDARQLAGVPCKVKATYKGLELQKATIHF